MTKRGRPRKTLIPQDPGSESPVPKKRGRPSKAEVVQSNDSNPWSTALALSRSVSRDYAMTEAEQELAFNCALALRRGAIMVELGVMYGSTAIILASAAQLTHAHYYGIDNFRMGSSPEEVNASLAKANLTGTILRGDTNQVKWTKPIDLLLFDAGHDDLNMRQDTARWLPRVSPGGLVLFHAYNPDIDYSDPHFPVKRYCDERTEGWDQIAYIPYLLVKQKPL